MLKPPDDKARSPFGAIADTQAAVAATPEYVVIVFRGTQEGADWVTNLKFRQKKFPVLGKVHKVIRRRKLHVYLLFSQQQ